MISSFSPFSFSFLCLHYHHYYYYHSCFFRYLFPCFGRKERRRGGGTRTRRRRRKCRGRKRKRERKRISSRRKWSDKTRANGANHICRNSNGIGGRGK